MSRQNNTRIPGFRMEWKGKRDIPEFWLEVVSNFVRNFQVLGGGAEYRFDGRTPVLNLPSRTCPYSISIATSNGVSTVRVAYGILEGEKLVESGWTTFGGVPTMGSAGAEIGSTPAPELGLTSNKTNVILLKVTTDPSELIKSAEIVAAASDALPENVPADITGGSGGNGTDGTYYLEIGRVDVDADGLATNPRNAWCGSVQFKGCGDGNVQWSILISGSVTQDLAASGA